MIKHPLFILTAYPNCGGIETVTTYIAQSLYTSYGVNVDIFSFIYNEQYKHIIPNGVKVHKALIQGGYDEYENQNNIERIARECQADVLIYQDSYAPSHKLIVRIAQNLKLPLIVFEHNTPDYGLNPRYYGVKRKYEKGVLQIIHRQMQLLINFMKTIRHKRLLIERKRYLYNNCNKYVLLSDKFIPIFKRIVPDAKEPKLLAISNPVRVKEKGDNIKKENIIFCASRLVAQKNIIEMLYMWKQIQSLVPDWKFIIAGTGSDEDALKNCAKALSLKNVEFIGYVDPIDYYRRSKIFWMTSLFEGFGLTLVEAQTYGCVPIVYENFASVVDIIKDGKNGYTIKSGDRNSFIDMTLRLMRDERLRSEMSMSAIHNYNRFDINIIKKQWMNLFTSI